jgi:hypothetical protein
VALPALHWKVTLDELKVEPGGGFSITAGPVGGVGVALGPGVGVGPPEPTLRIPVPVAVWPSGFVIVTFCEPADAALVFKSKVTWVEST